MSFHPDHRSLPSGLGTEVAQQSISAGCWHPILQLPRWVRLTNIPPLSHTCDTCLPHSFASIHTNAQVGAARLRVSKHWLKKGDSGHGERRRLSPNAAQGLPGSAAWWRIPLFPGELCLLGGSKEHCEPSLPARKETKQGSELQERRKKVFAWGRLGPPLPEDQGRRWTWRCATLWICVPRAVTESEK